MGVSLEMYRISAEGVEARMISSRLADTDVVSDGIEFGRVEDFDGFGQ